MQKSKPKKLGTTITRAAFTEKLKQVAEKGRFIEYKRVNDYWTQRIDGIKLPTEMVFLVGASPYRFMAVSIEKMELAAIPEYARKIVSKTDGGELVYGITCEPIAVSRNAQVQSQLTEFHD